MTGNLKGFVWNRYHTEIAENYWNREYLDYSASLANIVRFHS